MAVGRNEEGRQGMNGLNQERETATTIGRRGVPDERENY